MDALVKPPRPAIALAIAACKSDPRDKYCWCAEQGRDPETGPRPCRQRVRDAEASMTATMGDTK